MKLLNELRLRLGNPKWVLDAELAVIDTILDENPRLYEIVGADLLELNKSSKRGRQDSPTVEQVVRAALYKEIKKLTPETDKFVNNPDCGLPGGG